MRVTLDHQQMRSCMELWRHALALKNQPGDGVHDQAAERATMLAKVRGTVSGWLDLLRLCSPDDSEAPMLLEITAEAMDFLEWADEARLAFNLMKQSKHR